jgi:hypothetical protein
MENNNLCTSINPAPLPGCDENYVNPVKTMKVEASVYEKYKDVIEEAKRTGQPIIIHAGDLSVAQTIALAGSMADLSLATLHTPLEIGMLPVDIPKIMAPFELKNHLLPLPIVSAPGVEQRKQIDVSRELTLKDMGVANIPDATKKLIAAEYMRLCRKHPNWKAHKAMRKAGEKYSVKFTFDDNETNS